MNRPLRSRTIVDYILSDIFTSEEKWIKENIAEDKYGNRVAIHSKKAVCWCLEGAIQKAAKEKKFIDKPLNNQNREEYIEITNEVSILLSPKLGNTEWLTEFNDKKSTTYNTIIDVLIYGSNAYYR